MRSRVGEPEEFFLAFDCWMALTVEYTLRLIEAMRPYRFKWVEEFLPPDDYAGYAEVRRRAPRDLLLTTGEHEWTRWGFRQLIDNRCADIVQPDVNWCGGLTELLKIAAYASANGVLVVPHGSSVYSYHFVCTRHESPFAEFLMMAPDAASVVPMFTPLLTGEPVPERGRIRGVGARPTRLRRRARPLASARAAVSALGGGAQPACGAVDVLLAAELGALDANTGALPARRDEARWPAAPRAKHDVGAWVAELGNGGRHVIHPEADVMQALTVLLEEGAKWRARVERLHELNVGVACVEVGEADVRRLEFLGRVDREPETVAVEAQRVVGASHEHGDVVESPDRGHAGAVSVFSSCRS